MNVNLRNHWTSLLGAILIVTAFITLFKFSVDEGWITDGMKIGAGLLAGAGMCFGGVSLAVRKRQIASGEIVIGLGASVLYATVAFAGIYERFWDSAVVSIGMIAVTAALTGYAYRFGSRLLINISLAGGLVSPLLMQPVTDQVFELFLYLLVLNSAFFFVSIAKGWNELRIASFFGSWLLYAVYYVHFDPPTDGLWSMPIRYALAAFIFYLIGLMAASWMNNRCFDGWNLYLIMANGVMFGFWSILILDGDLHFAYILGFMGLIYLAAGALTYRWTGKLGSASLAPLLAGLLLSLLAMAQIGAGSEAKPLVNVYVWSGIVVILLGLGRRTGKLAFPLIAAPIWLIVGIYWYIVTWDAPRGDWFGIYMPFLNTGAVAWMLLAAIGFYFSLHAGMLKLAAKAEELVSHGAALLAHLVVGGLLTLQIENGFWVYAGPADLTYLSTTLSVVWGLYALLLFLWGAYRRQKLFRWFGSVVLVLVACKAVFLDMRGEHAIVQVLVLLALGGISFAATWVNGKWKTAEESEIETESETTRS